MPRILITGASGQLGAYLLKLLRGRETQVVAWSGSRTGRLFGFELRPVDLAELDLLASAYRQAKPDVIIHAGALSRIDTCFDEPDRAQQVNASGAAMLAELAEQSKSRLVYVSTDLVFDGRQSWYREDQTPLPVSVYGRSKLDAERHVLAHGGAAVVRVSLMFGPTLIARRAFFDQRLEDLRDGRSCNLFEDEWRTPLSLHTAAQGLVALAQSDFEGLLHFGGPERMSRLEMGQRMAAVIGADPCLLEAARQSDMAFPEPRPSDVSLDSSRFRELLPGQAWPNLEDALLELGVSRAR